MYPQFRMRFNDVAGTQSFFYIKEAGLIGKLKSNATEYTFNGEYTGQTEDELIASSREMSPLDWAAVAEDNATLSERVGSHPIRVPH